jgi:hypothetical protein
MARDPARPGRTTDARHRPTDAAFRCLRARRGECAFDVGRCAHCPAAQGFRRPVHLGAQRRPVDPQGRAARRGPGSPARQRIRAQDDDQSGARRVVRRRGQAALHRNCGPPGLSIHRFGQRRRRIGERAGARRAARTRPGPEHDRAAGSAGSLAHAVGTLLCRPDADRLGRRRCRRGRDDLDRYVRPRARAGRGGAWPMRRAVRFRRALSARARSARLAVSPLRRCRR